MSGYGCDAHHRAIARVVLFFQRKLAGRYFGVIMANLLLKLWNDDEGQDIAEYAVMLAAILIIVVGTIRLIGTNANTVFSNAASSIQ